MLTHRVQGLVPGSLGQITQERESGYRERVGREGEGETENTGANMDSSSLTRPVTWC